MESNKTCSTKRAAKDWRRDITMMNDDFLVKIIKDAAKKAILSLFATYDENYYYLSLITDASANCPIISAWSWEALEREAEKAPNVEEAMYYLKWSYADSPYCMFGKEYFSKVEEAFDSRDSLLSTDDEWDKEYDIRMNSMEKAIAELDNEGLFGTNEERLKIVINVEVMPPDYSNTLRALRLNPREALNEWLEEIAEEEPDVQEPKVLVDVILNDNPPNGLKDLVRIKKVFSLDLSPKELISIVHDIPVKIVTKIDKDVANRLVVKSEVPEIFTIVPSK